MHWLLKAMAAVASETYTATSAPIQYAAITAFNGNPEIDRYLTYSRKILGALGRYLAQQLRKAHITLPDPEGGFYLFPNFEYYREKLVQKNILSSVEMCNAILQDTGVAMLPGKDFGRQPEELTVRIAYVDFDGDATLKAAMERKIDKPISEKFLNQYCFKVIKAIDLLIAWMES
jgi:aspartate aminotransferase